jgi:hypothetical protein
LTALRGKEPEFESVIATIGFDSGRHYWSLKLDEYGHEHDIFIGICKREVNGQPISTNKHLLDSQAAWGWICTDGKKVAPGVGSHSYGDYSKIGEELGVLLEFR